jgi:hypothetical protein
MVLFDLNGLNLIVKYVVLSKLKIYHVDVIVEVKLNVDV